MARRNQRSRDRASSQPSNLPPGRGFRGLSRRARVWLATLGTIVGVGTGMVTLADEVVPKHSSSAQASLPQYQQSIATVCSEINRHEQERAEEAGRLARRLHMAKTTLAQRNALLESTLRSLRDGEHDLAMFDSLEVPRVLSATERKTTRAWNRNIDRVRDYAHHLDLASSSAKLDAAVDVLAGIRKPQQRDGTVLRTGLLRLGGGQCQLDPERVTKIVTLPVLAGLQGKLSINGHTISVNPLTAYSRTKYLPRDVGPASGGAPSPAVNAPKASADMGATSGVGTPPGPRVNAPGVSSGGNSLGG
jgi:hypothetical protein